jgi:RNA polymerase sigma-70 factor (ECF subfamily)
MPVGDLIGDSVARSSVTLRQRARFEEVYEQYFDEVSRWIRALGGPEDEREDLTQDVFLVVHRRLADFDGHNLPGWLYQIARRRVRDCRLRWFRLSLGNPLVDDMVMVASGVDPEAALRAKESEALLARILSKLPDTQRAAFVLFEIEEYSGEEVAQIQSVPVNTVWARIHTARQKLVAHLARLHTTSSGGFEGGREAPPLSMKGGVR